MHIDQMRRAVFKYRPELGEIYKKEGKSTIADYAKRIYADRQPSDKIVIDAIAKIAEEVLGLAVAQSVRASLQKSNYVSTVDHHGPICHPSFFQPNLLRTALDEEASIPATVVLSCASVTLNNHSFPQGLYFHNRDGEKVYLPILGVRQRRVCVYGQRSFSREEAETFLSRLENHKELYAKLAPTFLDENLSGLKSYRSQVTLINHRLMQAAGLGGSDFVSLPIEDVTREILLVHHFGKDTPISRILFHKKTRDTFLKETDGIQTSHDLARENTTVLFWGLIDGRRISLRERDGVLIDAGKNTHVVLDREHIETALLEEKIFPNLALCLIILSYHGLVLGGGFSQVDYLPELVRKTRKVFSRTGEKTHVWGFTGFMGGDFMYLPKYLGNDITLADVLNNPVKKSDFSRCIHKTAVAEAIDSIIPDAYKIITAKLKKKKTCLYCGNSQTTHYLEWIVSTVSIAIVNPLAKRLFCTRVGRILFRLAEWVQACLYDAFALFGIMRFDPHPSSVLAPRGRVMFDEAIVRGWKIEAAMIYGRAMDTYRVTLPNGRMFFFSGLPRPEIYESPAVGWMDDKALLKRALEEENIPVPRGGSFSSWAKAKRYFDNAKSPMIVKPRLGSRGRHTTTNLTKADDFEKAFRVAKQMGYFVIVEEHLEGSVYRATMIDGMLAGVLAGDPPRITGDGVKTIRTLIEIKNKNRNKRVSGVVISDALISFLERQNYTLGDVLSDGVTIDLSEKIGLAYGGKSREVTPKVHPKLRAELERAAKAVDDPVLGFDFIAQDVSLDPGTVRWGIIECNALPFINLHHDPLLGEPVNVARKLWDYVARKNNT